MEKTSINSSFIQTKYTYLSHITTYLAGRKTRIKCVLFSDMTSKSREDFLIDFDTRIVKEMLQRRHPQILKELGNTLNP